MRVKMISVREYMYVYSNNSHYHQDPLANLFHNVLLNKTYPRCCLREYDAVCSFMMSFQ